MPSWIIYPENTGTHLAIDEVALSQGELYTHYHQQKTKGVQGLLLGTKTEQVIEHVSN
jgi:predicted metal-dependent enzyme (double-stranded beta helix superfamily)